MPGTVDGKSTQWDFGVASPGTPKESCNGRAMPGPVDGKSTHGCADTFAQFEEMQQATIIKKGALKQNRMFYEQGLRNNNEY